MAGDCSLVVEYNVRQPDVLGRHVQFRDAAVLRRIPRELVVVPFLQKGHSSRSADHSLLKQATHVLHPEVCLENLILQVL